MVNCTAVILSARPVTKVIPGVEVLACVQTITTAEQLHTVRLNALASVKTPYFFYLDDDDDLPEDYLDVLADCIALDKPLVYTDELIVHDGVTKVSVSGPYDQHAHILNPTLVHHLVLMQTAAAQKASAEIPRGMFNEMLLFFRVAAGGAGYVNRVGYIWNKGRGMHCRPDTLIAQVASATWCDRSIRP